MAKTLPISATRSLFLPIRNTVIKCLQLAGAAATSVVEFFDGTIDSIASASASATGTGYAVGDLLTLAAGENGNADSRAIVRVTQIDFLSPSTSVSSSPSLSISSSRSPSVSPSASTSVSTSISNSVSSSASPSTSISNSPSPSPSISPSTSRSTSISLSPSSSISSSASASPSPSGAGTGGVTEVEVIFAGGGYTAGNVYATTATTGAGSGATIKVLTIEDTGVAIGKLQCVANESAAPVCLDTLITKGLSVRISGTNAKAFVTYE